MCFVANHDRVVVVDGASCRRRRSSTCAGGVRDGEREVAKERTLTSTSTFLTPSDQLGVSMADPFHRKFDAKATSCDQTSQYEGENCLWCFGVQCFYMGLAICPLFENISIEINKINK